MKFLPCFIVVVFLLCHSVPVFALDGKLTFDSDHPQAGSTIGFSYLLSDRSQPANDLKVALIYYSPEDINNPFVVDISLREQGAGLYKGTFQLPAQAVAFALLFRANHSIDTNGGKGFIYPACTGDHPVKGNDAGRALFFAYGDRLGLAGQTGLAVRRDTALALFQRSLEQYPAETLPFEHHYYYLLLQKEKEAANPVVEKRAVALLNRPLPSPLDYQQAMTLYQLTKNFHTADSVLKEGSKRYPGSDLAILQFDKEFNEYDSIPNMLRIYALFKKAYNVNDLAGKPAETFAYWSSFIAYRYMQRKDFEKAIYYTDGIRTPRLLGYRLTFLDMIATAMLDNHSGVTPLVDSLVSTALQSLKIAKDSPSRFKFQYETADKFLARFEEGTEAPVMDVYAKVQALKGKYEEALHYQEKAIAILQWSNPDFNEHYMEYLVKCGQFKTALEKAKLIFVTGNTNPRFRELMQQAYRHENGSDSGFAKMIAAMEEPIKERLRDSIGRQQLSAETLPLSLPDLQGRQISLDALKGKVVILDFWATWCTPCKAALPTMQRAVNQYKNDTGVVFLFVDTWEVVPKDTRMQLINNLVKSKGYSLTILLDQLQNLETRSYLMSGRYDIKGLPTKLVINTRGQVQFRNIGFDGNEDKLLNEVNEMIRMARE
jgi:thiol-disulfide isomerase/thioredoxin